MLIMAILAGFSTLHATEVKIKKIIYSQNIIYEGEAIKSGKAWIPQGEGVLYFSKENIFLPYLNPSVTYFRLSGIFNDKEVVSASLTRVAKKEVSTRYVGGTAYIPPKDEASSDEKDDRNIFEGELSISISSDGKMYYGDISLSFESGCLFEVVNEFSPFSIKYGAYTDNEKVEFEAELSNIGDLKTFDPYGIKSGVNYSSEADMVFSVGRETFDCYVTGIRMIKWEDGSTAEPKSVVQVTRGNRRWFAIEAEKGDHAVRSDGSAVLATFNEHEYIIYPVRMSDYTAMSFKNEFSRVLSDGTIVRGVHKDNKPHVRYVKCTDGQSFEGRDELGVIIKGGETMSSLFVNDALTKDDIKLFNGTLFDTDGEEIDSFRDGVGLYGEFPHF